MYHHPSNTRFCAKYSRGEKTSRQVQVIPYAEYKYLPIYTERGEVVKRVFGQGSRYYGLANLKEDSSAFLNPYERYYEYTPLEKFSRDLGEIRKHHQGCIVKCTLEYFEHSTEVIPYVDVLTGMCIADKYIMQALTKNFTLISNIKVYGERIKAKLFCNLIQIHQDLTSFGYTKKNSELEQPELNRHLLLRYYDRSVALAFYEFVSLLFFRFRKGIDAYGRHKALGKPAVSALKFLLIDGSLDSLKLLTSLVQLNWHSLAFWFNDELKIIAMNIARAVRVLHSRRGPLGWDWKRYFWLSAAQYIINDGPILDAFMYKQFEKLFRDEWKNTVVYPPVQILEFMDKSLVANQLDKFHVDDYDILRNMFVYLP